MSIFLSEVPDERDDLVLTQREAYEFLQYGPSKRK